MNKVTNTNVKQLEGLVAAFNAQLNGNVFQDGTLSFELVEREEAFFTPEDFREASHDVWLNFEDAFGRIHGLDGMPSKFCLEDIAEWGAYQVTRHSDPAQSKYLERLANF